MKTITLAAGYATRLYPLTENFPKPLLEVGGKPILDHLIGDLDASGLVDGYIVVSNHRFASIFEDWAARPSARSKGPGQDPQGATEPGIASPKAPAGPSATGKGPGGDPQGADHPGIARPTGQRKPNPRISIVDDGTSTNETRLGAVRDIQLGIEAAGADDDLFVMAGDNLLSFSLCDFLSYAREKGTTCIMRYYEADPARLRKSGVAEVDASGRVLSMEEKPAQPKDHWCCPPFYYIARADVPKVAEAISSGCGVDAPGSFIAWLSARTTVHAWEMPGPRYDIGSLESYEEAKRLFDR